MKGDESRSLYLIPLILCLLAINNFWTNLLEVEKGLFVSAMFTTAILVGLLYFSRNSKWGRDRAKRIGFLKGLPAELLNPGSSVLMGVDVDLEERIYLSDQIRKRHVHIIGATGAGKTESVILNFLKQDVARGLGSIILDAKGDASFLEELRRHVPGERLHVFDLSDADSTSYDPLKSGAPLEAAQRLFASLNWSEEYYKSKALTSLQRLFQTHFDTRGCNPSLSELAGYLETPKRYSAFVNRDDFPTSLAMEEFKDLSGLRDQVRMLSIGYLAKILSSPAESNSPVIELESARDGVVIYFRLQSLLSSQLVSILGRLAVNHMAYLAGSAHRVSREKARTLVPVYLDEFASFACPEFADLISKARSANFALHFSHQSVGDLVEVSEGFLSRITDNSATKIVMRINDPESAEFFARSFGTREFQKSTQRVTNAKNMETAEIVGEGTVRDARQFRASPDLLKTLPTGMGAVLVSHGYETPEGASTVFKIRFPQLN